MEKSLADVVSELEKAVLPLGFMVGSVNRVEKPGPLIKSDVKGADNDPELLITIVRKGKLG